ncbi:hypothetical protein BDY24DRAFT_378531 [Mrakia frigida]|uniref:uncharacterized protein n=1 Tax=Mrakia frigida TaxID=29902 RepID=UPI003FCBF32F
MSSRPHYQPSYGGSPAPSSVQHAPPSASAASVLSPPLEVARQLDLFMNEHLNRLEALADQYFDGVDSSLNPSATTGVTTASKAEAYQSLLTHLTSLLSASTSSGLGALPVSLASPTSPSTISSPPLPPSLNEWTEGLSHSVQERFGRRVAVKDAAAVGEGVLKRG